MQSNLETKLTHALHGREDGQLARGLATGKDHAVEQTPTPTQQLLDTLPRNHSRDLRVDNRLIVAVRARPRTPLGEHCRHKLPRPVHAGHRGQTRDLQVRGGQGCKVHRWSTGGKALTNSPCSDAAASENIVRSAYSPFLPILKDFTGRK